VTLALFINVLIIIIIIIIKVYTDIYVILTYTGTETDASFGLFIPEIHFFGQGLKFYSPLKGLISSQPGTS